MSFNLSTLVYWLVILTWVSCTAEPGNNATKTEPIKKDNTTTVVKPIKITNTTSVPKPVTTAAPTNAPSNVTTAAPQTTAVKITTDVPTNTTAAPVTVPKPATGAKTTVAQTTVKPAKVWILQKNISVLSDKEKVDLSDDEFKIKFIFKSTTNKNFISINTDDLEFPPNGLRVYLPVNGSKYYYTISIKVNESYPIEISQEKDGDAFRAVIKVNDVIEHNVTKKVSVNSPLVIKEKSANGTAIYSQFVVYKKGSPTPAPTIPTTTTPVVTAPPSKLQKVTLKRRNVTAQSISVEWQRDSALNQTDRFNLTIVLSIQGGGQDKTKDIMSQAGSTGEYTFTDLKPYSEYTITAREKLETEEGPESALLTVKTSQAAPTKPQNLQVGHRSDKSIEITWDAPADLNGIVVEVMVNYTFKENPSPSSKVFPSLKERKVTLDDLFPYVEYTILVSEKTVEYGPFSNISATTMKSAPRGRLDVAPLRFMDQIPWKDMHHNSLVKVLVVWTPLPRYRWGDEYVEYKITGLGDKDIFTRETQWNMNLTAYKKYTLTLSAGNSKGYNEAITKELMTRETAPSKPRDLVIKPKQTQDYFYHNINISWSAPEYLNGIPTSFKYSITKLCMVGRCKREIELNRIERIIVDFKKAVERTYIIKTMWGMPLDAYSKYEIDLEEQTCRACWGDTSDKHTVETLPGVPGPVHGFRKDKLDSSSVVISWKPPYAANGKILYYEVALRDTLFSKKVIDTGSDDYSTKFEDLDDETGYTVEIVAVNEGPVKNIRGRKSEFYFQTLQSRTWLFILIGCLVVVLIVVLILAIYLLVSRRRRTYKGVPTNGDMEMNTKTKAKPIPISNFKNYCAQQHANSDHGFQQEYEQLRTPVRQFTWDFSSMPCNQVKNRYSNIVAYDHSRVILETIEDDPSSSYINANYIDGYLREKQYIATQGPLPETIIDFWRMIWDEKCPIIVMLTKLVEDNKLKCEQYWPEGKAMQYRDIVVTIMSVEEMTDMTVKVFKLHKINNPELGSREVRHFHYTAWPDHGVPAHPTSMLSFIKHVMSYFPKELLDPIVIHCSAGVGRTGTFIAIEGLLRQMENHDTVDVFGTVLRMRMQRNFMVQTESQYTFIYDALLDNVVCGNTEISPENLVTRIKYLNEQDNETGETRFMSEFKRLESGFRIKDKEQFTDASHPENKTKNRFLNILPFDKNRIRLSPVAGARLSDYINASIIDGFNQKHAFIATQAPLENTVVDFWRMVSEQNVHVIVMLTKIEEKGQEKCYLYWPQAGMVSYGSIHVEVVNVRNQDDVYIIHDLRVTNRESGKSWPVTHFLYLGWPEYHGSPDSGTDLIHFIGLVEKTQRSLTDAGPTLVHCSGGVGRTGVFITVFNSVERLKNKSVVDVFQTTRALRLQRSAMVQTIDQYKFCYQCLKDYLDSFDLYANPEC